MIITDPSFCGLIQQGLQTTPRRRRQSFGWHDIRDRVKPTAWHKSQAQARARYAAAGRSRVGPCGVLVRRAVEARRVEEVVRAVAVRHAVHGVEGLEARLATQEAEQVGGLCTAIQGQAP